MKEQTQPEAREDAAKRGISYLTPIYIQLREIVRNKIEEGEYAPGKAIPSENELAETYGINRITVRNAMDALVKEGMLQRVQGKGVFVVGNREEQALEEYGGFILSSGRGRVSASVKEQVKGSRPAGDKFAHVFDIAPEQPIFYLRQIVSHDGQPVSIDEIFVPEDVIPQLDEVNSSVFSMSDVFAFYGIEMCSMRQNMEIVPHNSHVQKLLDVPDGVALLMMECTYNDKNGRTIEYSRSYYRSDKCTFKIQLHKQ